jgi:DNA adenine methylase
LKASPARFILSTWHHNDFRSNESLTTHWSDFHVVTREHFYHAGAKETNRRPIVEALVMNFTPKAKPIEQPELDEGDDSDAPEVVASDNQIPLEI